MTISKKDLETLAKTDVLSQPAPDAEAVEIEKKIKELQKGASVTIKLSSVQLARIQREASILNIEWKEYFSKLVSEKILDVNVGAAVISKPSFATAKITGPSAKAWS